MFSRPGPAARLSGGLHTTLTTSGERTALLNGLQRTHMQTVTKRHSFNHSLKADAEGRNR